jgi:hypothetical protein
MANGIFLRAGLLAVAALVALPIVGLAEPPALNPFGQSPSEREDAVYGVIELSDGTSHAGMIYLTRDKRFQIYDEHIERQREVPLQAIKKIECSVKWEKLEKEWKFKEAANDEKMYTGRRYPAREYVHTITLKNGRTITGPLSAVIYLQPPQQKTTGTSDQPQAPVQAQRFVLYKRNKGELGQTLKKMVYVKCISLGKDAAGKDKDAAEQEQ